MFTMISALLATSAAAQSEPEPAEPEPAEPAEPEPPTPIEIPPVDEALPSALDTLSGAAGARIDAGEFDPDALVRAQLGAFVRSRFTVRPVASWITLLGPQGGHAVTLGGAVGHQLYTLDSLPVQAGLDSRLELTAPVGGARGHRLEAATALSSWFGPLGPSIGPVVRWDQQAWAGGAALPWAVSVGAELGLALDTGPVQPRIAVAPVAIVAGDRAPAGPGDVPVLFDETTWRAGVRFAGQPLHIGLDGALHRSVAGTAVEAGLVLHLQPF